MRDKIFCRIRKRYIALTPEERVRQYTLSFLIDNRKISPSLIAVEAEIKIGTLSKRFDILVYDKDLKPLILIECKREEIQLNQEIVNQAIRYNQTILSPYILITNGCQTLLFKKDKNSSMMQQTNSFPII